MKKMIVYAQKSALFTCFFVASLNLYAQMTIGPGASSTNGSATLEIKAGPYSSGSPYRGILLPTVTTTQRSQIQNPAAGLLVFNITTQQLEVNTGTPTAPIWTPGGATGISSGVSWNITGNAGTTSANFLGTTDNNPLYFRVNNQNAGRIDPIRNNVALGQFAFSATATGQGNTAIGNASLFSNTSSDYNTAIGYQALLNNTAGGGNTASGAVSLRNNTSGHDNTALGVSALGSNTVGNYNVAGGAGALGNNTSGGYNTALGHNALLTNTTGNGNIGLGEDALVHNVNGNDNVALGTASLVENTTGGSNMASGNLALRLNTTGGANTASGTLALQYNTIGSFNTALGYSAGPLSTNANLSNATAIGANSVVGASNTIVLGDNKITSLRCNVQTISALSDKRIKEDIKANVPGLSFVTKLTPVTYHVNKTKEANLLGYPLSTIHEDKVLHSGFLAQDVEAIAKSVGYDFEGVQQEEGGKYYTVGYTLFVMPLVQAVKELNTEVEQLNAELAAAKQSEKTTQDRLEKIEALLQNPTRPTSISFSTK